MCCLNEVSSIASTNGAFVAITEKGNIVPWGNKDHGGAFNNDYAIKQLKDDKTKVKFTIFCIFFSFFYHKYGNDSHIFTVFVNFS